MIDEIIKKEVERQLSIKDKKQPKLEDIILNGAYTVLVFHDRSDGANLTPNFNINVILGSKILIKSFKIVPYAFSEVDILWNDTVADHYTVPPGARLFNVIDEYSTTCRINFIING